MKSFTSSLIDCTEDKYFRCDEKYHIVLKENLYNVFNVDNTIKLSEILIEDYCNFEFQDDMEYRGIPTGQAYIDEDGYIIDNQPITKDNHPDRLKYKINSENILLSSLRLAKSPALNFHNDDVSDCVFSNGFYIFKTRKDWNKKFVLYVLRHPKIKNLLDNHLYRGIGISAYKVEDLYKCNIKAITPNKQKEAVSLIEPIEQNIFSLKRTIKPAQQIIDEVFKKEFGSDKSLMANICNGMSVGLKKVSNGKYNFYKVKLSYLYSDSLRISVRANNIIFNKFQDVLKKQNCLKLKDVVLEKIHNGDKPIYNKIGNIPVIKTAQLSAEGVNKDELEFVTYENYTNCPDAQIRYGDILICNIGKGSLGKVVLFEEDENMFAVNEICIVRLNSKLYNSNFLVYFLKSVLGVYQFEREYTGTTNQIHLKPENVENFLIPNIPLSEQERIVNEIQSEIDKQTEIKNKIADLRNKIDDIIENTIKEG